MYVYIVMWFNTDDYIPRKGIERIFSTLQAAEEFCKITIEELGNEDDTTYHVEEHFVLN